MTDLNDLAPLAARQQGIADAVERLATTLEATAVARDAAGGHAAAEREAIRASGLLALSIPEAYGGLGVHWTTVLQISRRLARVDSALAHLFAFHHLQIASLLLYGHAEQQARHLREKIGRAHV
jgi:alkylation response protein AidB-like acyl-CoA dehydrogenase